MLARKSNKIPATIIIRQSAYTSPSNPDLNHETFD
jgi:hypothetical protein